MRACISCPVASCGAHWAAEMGKGALERFEKLREPLVGTRVIEPAAAA